MDETALHWANFFVAQVGAAAALAGLIIVAISINLQRILAYPHLPGRAFEALMLLVAAMLICGIALIPGQTPTLFGLEILLIEFFVLLTSIVQQVKATRTNVRQQTSWVVVRALVLISSSVPIVIGGIILASGHVAGLYWVAPGVLIAIAASILNSWVLLIEILR
jgi:modulator of FtsH protease